MTPYRRTRGAQWDLQLQLCANRMLVIYYEYDLARGVSPQSCEKRPVREKSKLNMEQRVQDARL